MSGRYVAPVNPAIERLLEPLGELADLDRAAALLAWDERTQMPAGGAPMRAEQLGTLARLRHERATSDAFGELLDAAAGALDGAPEDSFEASLVRVASRDWEKTRRVPAELVAETARVTSIAERAWEQAREDSDFAAFRPHLERVIELRRRYLECFEFDHPYDPLLDDFEPGMRTAELRPVLAGLASGLADLVARIGSSAVEVDASCLHGGFDREAQERFARELTGSLPLEPGSWRLDSTVHPFATVIGASDLRITTRFDPEYVGTALWAVIHETGHVIYYNGIDRELERTPLFGSSSLGFDESQSRLWENWVGRGRPYLRHIHPMLDRHFPGRFDAVDAEGLYLAANRVEPSLIRVEADEVTYNLHVILRFELEAAIFEGALAVADLPEAWRQRSRELLGVEPPDDASGVLQDVHWSGGAFGYFPTYSLGNVIAGQLWDAAREAIPSLDEMLAAGELEPLREFLRDRVHRHGRKFEPGRAVEIAVGSPLDPAPLLRQLNEKYGEVYAL